ncbi:VOC family protein [Subtercola sp. PAMC28395]|uniref:VOC family protein n=1 Tax=Subtercola sp. PAMC28395 TaxID=2846775 RepID=UPI001C0D5A3E|nr:VOC family protein [Subtercola sp. PAMC28395]QWT24218.1 VOC family protein [Subtercola sp. PAMC28395]
MIGSVDEIVVDCRHPEDLARFWAAILGGEPRGRDEAWWYIVPPGWSQLSFQKVPEPKSVKNRLHIDVRVGDIAEATREAERLGARRIGDVHADVAGSFQVLQDPEGNEWCVVKPA